MRQVSDSRVAGHKCVIRLGTWETKGFLCCCYFRVETVCIRYSETPLQCQFGYTVNSGVIVKLALYLYIV